MRIERLTAEVGGQSPSGSYAPPRHAGHAGFSGTGNPCEMSFLRVNSTSGAVQQGLQVIEPE
jgi:hypothetical protein